MVMQVQWKWLLAFCFLSLAVAKETQIKLEDIERDTLNIEKSKQQQEQQIQQQYQPQIPQQPQQILHQPPQTINLAATLQNLPPTQYYTASPPPPPPSPPQPTGNPLQRQPQPPLHQQLKQYQQQQQLYQLQVMQQQQQPTPPPELAFGPHQFAPEARQFPPPPPLQLQFPSRVPQQQLALHPQQQELVQILAQPNFNVPSGHGQQFQFTNIAENSIFQDPILSQYFGAQSAPQQYVLLQSQPSNNIPIQTKSGAVQFVQFLDANSQILQDPKNQAKIQNHYHKSGHNLAGLIQRTAYTNVLPVNYKGPAPQTYRPQGQAQPLLPQNIYVVPPIVQPANSNLHPLYIQQTKPPRLGPKVLGQQQLLVPGIIYANPQRPPSQPQPYYEHQQAQQSTTNIVFEKREPKSLLDSYIPSYLQIQYYKQLQQANSLQQDEKNNEKLVGKSEVIKNFSGPIREIQYELQ